MPPQKKKKHYTYADYVTWPDDERWELINGVPYAMFAAPKTISSDSPQMHQEMVGEIHRQLANFLKGKPCKIFMAPFDVRLNADNDDDIVVQPDVLVVCDKNKLDGKCCNGAPDFVVEILSPSTAARDRVDKFQAYLAAGVREYWIVDPETKTIQVCVLQNSFYAVVIHKPNQSLPVTVLEGCSIDMREVFAE